MGSAFIVLCMLMGLTAQAGLSQESKDWASTMVDKKLGDLSDDQRATIKKMLGDKSVTTQISTVKDLMTPGQKVDFHELWTDLKNAIDGKPPIHRMIPQQMNAGGWGAQPGLGYRPPMNGGGWGAQQGNGYQPPNMMGNFSYRPMMMPRPQPQLSPFSLLNALIGGFAAASKPH